MKTVTIYGHSDDLIEIEGDLRDEIWDENAGSTKLGFSDGTVLTVEYDSEGFWRVNRVHVGTARYEKTEATDPDGDYSDRVTLTGDLKWMVAGKDLNSIG
jgi:hypothetical protein